ncbi:MAG: matrixin family metalloprotease, partial [Pirellulaceae bacterium]|nr:matrixin family metalloprotease [Pirellulaceae bacterium]
SAGALPAETPLLAEGDPRDAGAATVSLSQLQPVIAEASARWSATGLTADQASALSQTQFVVADLGGAYLGLANTATNQIRIDDNAAGLGWSMVSGHSSFVTGQWSLDYGQMTNDKGQLTTDGVDLLTVVMHEMGHLLGYEHSAEAEDLMAPVLWARRSGSEADRPVGQTEWRRGLDFPGALDGLFAELADDGPACAYRVGRMRHDEADTTVELLESGEVDWMRPEGAASPAAEAVQLRVPRRSRLQRYQREADAWFDGLAREVEGAADLSSVDQS